MPWTWSPERSWLSHCTALTKATRRRSRRRWPKPASASRQWWRRRITAKWPRVSAEGPREVITDKGYHSRAVVNDLAEWGVRTYCSEPNRGRQRWQDRRRGQRGGYANRRRIRGERGRRLLRQRGEKLERWNQHLYDRGGMRRVHLRGRENILKRLGVHSGGGDLGVLVGEEV